jgi:hypothetical protein
MIDLSGSRLIEVAMVTKPETVRVQARNVVPYRYALWCRIEGGKPFANEIVGKRPSDNGTHLWLMLDSHNFIKAEPDEWLELVPIATPKTSGMIETI